MVEKKVDTENSNDIKDFPLSRLDNQWPFSLELATTLFMANSKKLYPSFKEFLISTWLNYCEEISNIDSSSSSSDEDADDKNTTSWPHLKYDGFFIENGRVYFQEVGNQKSKTLDNLTEKESEICVYTLEKIPYRMIIREATRFYIKSFFQGKIMFVSEGGKRGEDQLRSFSAYKVWPVIFDYLLFTPYSFCIRRLLEEEKYTTTYEKEIIGGFYIPSKNITSFQYDLNKLLVFFNTEIEENLALDNLFALRERFENLFASSGLSTNKSNELIDNFFSTKSFHEIASYYEKEKEAIS